MNSREWQEKIESYQQSKMSLSAWCRAQGISASTVQYHLKKLKKSEEKRFVELKPSIRGIRLSWRNITLELDPDFDENTLQRFLSVLR